MDSFLHVNEVDNFLRERRAVRSGGGRSTFARVSTDSRQVQAGDLFVALVGESFDGHSFVAQSKAAGAGGAVVLKTWASGQDRATLSSNEFALWMVDDTLLALGDVARGHLRRLDLFRGALSGSNGKTTTKEMCAAILRAHLGTERVLVTQGNLNNQIGLPLTALRATTEHRQALFEMGMNHAGEIAALCRVAEPQAGLITNVGPAHIGNFAGRIDGIASAKGELFGALAQGGMMVVNLDDELVVKQAGIHGRRDRVNYGRRAGADYRLLSNAPLGQGMEIELDCKGVRVKTTVPALGAHNALNACAAAALAMTMGASSDAVATGLSTVTLVSGRLTRRAAKSGATVLDDSYNANPASMKASLDVARAEADATSKRLILVLGDMLELGDVEIPLHREVGEKAAEVKPAHLFASGARSKAMADAALSSGMTAAQVHHADALEALLDAIKAEVKEQDVVLVKGSRGARMERAVAALCGETSKEGH